MGKSNIGTALVKSPKKHKVMFVLVESTGND